MPRDSLTSVLNYLHRLAGEGGQVAVSDTELLDRFARRRDQAAFELLVWRHGPMVLSLCRRLLHQEQDAEDAFQATFLTLVNKAGSIRKRDALASWLYKVAYRVACRARDQAIEVVAPNGLAEASVPAADSDAIWRELRSLLDAEVANLPESARVPIVLCYFEGKTHEEAAQLLGCPKGTVAARLARARDRLRTRLTRSGWALSPAVLAGVLAEKAMAAAISPELVHSAVNNGLAYAAGNMSVVSAKAVALTEGVLRMMCISKMKVLVGVILAVILSGVGVGLTVSRASEEPAFAPPAAAALEPPAQASRPAQRPAPVQGDAKAAIATLRAEMEKLRNELDAALKEIRSLKEILRKGTVELEQGPLYKGKPASYWLSQAEDGDEEFRAAAIKALGVLSRKDKKLIPALASALKDGSRSVGMEAAYALSTHGKAVVPLLLEILKDQNSDSGRARALVALSGVGVEAKVALPQLVAALKDPAAEVRGTAVAALGALGSEARPAIPALVNELEHLVKEMHLQAKQSQGKTSSFGGSKGIGERGGKKGAGSRPRVLSPRAIIDAIVRIDPDARQVLSDVVLGDKIPFPDAPAIAAEWQKGLDSLKKRYQKQ